MKLSWWMLAGSVVSALGITAFLGTATPLDVRLGVWLGMLAPLAATLCSWAVVERTYRTRPENLTRVMGTAFVVKMAFFGGYAVLVVKAGWVQPASFVISFTGYFLALHFIEAVRLKRLVANT
jgi:hypothetical protein